MLKYKKFLEKQIISEDDPFGEEEWEERKLDETPLYLSVDGPKTYDDGSPLQRPWIGKNFVLLENKGKYYKLGEIRYTNNPDFFMFYITENLDIERGRINQFRGEVLRELNTKEKKNVIEELNKERKFTRNLFDAENGRTYIDILNNIEIKD